MNKNELLVVKPFSGDITELFSENKTGKDKQWHFLNFKKLLKSIGTNIETLEIKVQKFVLNKEMSDFDIRNHIGLEKLVFKTKKQALAVLHASMTDEYRDGKANIVYYLDENGELCCVYCLWDEGIEEWCCAALPAYEVVWPVHSRVFYTTN